MKSGSRGRAHGQNSHNNRAAGTDLVLRAGNLELDLVTREARREGHSIELLPMEFRLREFLMRNAGQMK